MLIFILTVDRIPLENCAKGHLNIYNNKNKIITKKSFNKSIYKKL